MCIQYHWSTLSSCAPVVCALCILCWAHDYKSGRLPGAGSSHTVSWEPWPTAGPSFEEQFNLWSFSLLSLYCGFCGISLASSVHGVCVGTHGGYGAVCLLPGTGVLLGPVMGCLCTLPQSFKLLMYFLYHEGPSWVTFL